MEPNSRPWEIQPTQNEINFKRLKALTVEYFKALRAQLAFGGDNFALFLSCIENCKSFSELQTYINGYELNADFDMIVAKFFSE